MLLLSSISNKEELFIFSANKVAAEVDVWIYLVGLVIISKSEPGDITRREHLESLKSG